MDDDNDGRSEHERFREHRGPRPVRAGGSGSLLQHAAGLDPRTGADRGRHPHTPQSQDAESADAASSTGDAAPGGGRLRGPAARGRAARGPAAPAGGVRELQEPHGAENMSCGTSSGELISALPPVPTTSTPPARRATSRTACSPAIATKLRMPWQEGAHPHRRGGESFDPTVHEAT
ncbi:hypothetical protein QJS66_18045 [Kocuria rhizophila]|nr:hypothetical protein QJS66_18045 [Kocuria rhizophila]